MVVYREKVKHLSLLSALAVFLLSSVSPVFAVTPAISFTTNPSAIPVNGETSILMCMTGGSVGTIAATASGLGHSGLVVITPGTPTLHSTKWNFPAARGVVLPACLGQPLPSVCPTPPPVPGTDQSRECTNGVYSVPFGDNSPGWVRISGKDTQQTAESGTYTVDLDYKQALFITTKGAFFDVKTLFFVPEFAAPAVAVTAASLIGLVLLRRRQLGPRVATR